MVAIVAGQGLGLQNTSKELLGGGGVLGNASQGVTGEGVYVNASTGNLVVRQQDEWLVGVGPDAGITRTYNSLGAGTDDNGDNWQLGLSRRITGVTGGSGVSTAGSSVKRVGEDGVEEVYTWDAVSAAYVSKSGAGAYDTLKYSTSTADRPYEGWTWTDGDTQQVEHYAGTSGAGAKLKSVVDRDGNKIDLTYDSTRTNLISKISTTNGSGAGAEEIEVTYVANKNNIESLITRCVDGVQTKTLKRVTYGYDSSDRLNSVKVDLTPQNQQDSQVAGTVIETLYTYDGTSKRLKTLEQRGSTAAGTAVLSKLEFTYISSSDNRLNNRLQSIKETVNGQALVTEFDYSTAGLTKVKDALGQYTEIVYNDPGVTAADKQGQLKSIKLPTATQALVSYEYDDSGNVTKVTDGRGGETIYRYDSQGNRVYERNAEGNVIERSYGSANELLSETVYAVSDPDGAGAQLAGKPQTTYHVYDAKLHLRYVVNPLGQVTEHRYNELGQRTSTLQYTQGSFTVGAQSSWSDGFNNGLATWNITGSAYQVVNGKLEATSKQATQESNWASPQQFKPLGTTWRLEFRTPSSLSASRPVNFGLDSSSGEYRMYRLLIDGGNFKVASKKGSLGIAERTLGAVQPDKDYVLEIVTQASGELQMYVYEAGQDRSGGFVDTANLGLWAGTKFLLETRVDPQASSQPVKYVFDNLSAKTPAVPQLSELDEWRDSASQPQSDKSTVARTDYSYDTRGQLKTQTQFTQVSTAGEGVANGSEVKVSYTYDQSGNLLSKAEVGATGLNNVTSYAYDGLNRLKVLTDATKQQTQTEYLDASRQVKVTSANGLVTTTTYDEAGHVLTVSQTDPQAQQALQSLGTTKYSYDKLGRLIATELPSGQKSYIVYDTQGRKVADVDPEFGLTEYRYNDAGQVAHTTRYATAVKAGGQQALQAGEAVTVSALRTGNTNDRHTVYVYDAAGRLVKIITPNGTAYSQGALLNASVQEMRYDGAGQLIETIQYATQLGSTQANQLAANALTLKSAPGQIIAGSTTITLAVDAANDRHVRQFYDAAGRLIGKLDAENYYTAYAYDGAGRLVRTSRYAAAMVGTLLDAQTPPQIVAATASLPTQGAYVREQNSGSYTLWGLDQHTYRVYDGRGQVSAEIDAEGYVTAYEYDARGNLTKQKRHVNRMVSSAATGSILVGRVWSTSGVWSARYVVPNAGDWVTTHRYDELGRRYRTEVQPQGLVTTYSYDAKSGALVEVVTGLGAGVGVERTQRMKHDKLGRLTDELNAEGAKALAALGGSPTQAQIDTIWKQYGIHHDYDLSGNRIATTTPDGQGVAGLKTVYYYDRNGRLTHSINALGEVSSFVYNRFGEITEERKHANRLGALAGLTGGVSTSMSDEVRSALAALRVDGLDQYVQKDYFRSGALWYSGKGQSDEAEFFEYNAFGELKGSSHLTYVGEEVSEQVTQHRRDRRGLITETSKVGHFGEVDFGTTYANYDAFGRVVLSTDARGMTTTHIHDRLGRQIRVLEPNESINSTLRTTYIYDAFNRVVTLGEPGGQKTTFVYDDAQRTLTKRVPLDWVTNTTQYIETVTKQDVHGQTVEITDGRGYRRKFEYDLNGQLTKQELRDASDNLLDGEHKKNEYDKAGRLIVSWDKNQKVTIAYDKANRVLTRTVDAGAELLSSEYRYDALGQAVWTRDAAGVWTHTEYTQQGRVKRVTIDPLEVPKASEVGSQASASNVFALEANPKGAEAVNQVSEFSYSFTGELSRVTKGQGSATEVVAYVFDELGRRVAEIKDPDGLKLRTDYTYDQNGNVVARKDALGQVTRYVYDRSNRLVFEIDATGAVVRHDHDESGNVSRRVAYQRRLSQAGLALEVDRETIEGLLPAQPQAGDQVSYQFYDAANRLTMSVDALGHVTQRMYDKSGNLARITHYANAVLRQDVTGTVVGDRLSFKAPEVVGPTQSPANNQAPYVVRSADDQTEQYVYDAANRLTWKVDALGYATRYDYFGHGPSVTEIRYANAVKYPTGSTELAENVAPQVLWQEPANSTAAYVVASGKDVGGDRFYDNAGRLASVQDAESYYTIYTYDGAGRVRKMSRPVEPFSLDEEGAAITSYAYDGAGRLTEVTDAEGVKTQHKYDAAGNRVETTVAYGTTDASTTGYTYDDAGRLTAETRGKGTSDEATTSYVLNALGHRKEIIDPRGYRTLQDFDEAGRVKKVTDPLGGQTLTEYDAFGNAIKVTDPNGNAGYFFFDANNRNTWQVDPMGYATKTVYDAFGQAHEITKYDGAVKGTLSTATKLGAYASAQDATAAGSTAYVLVNADKDAKTTIWHDKLGRQTQIQDAEGHTEEMAYDGLGNKVKFTNKLGGVFTYTHDLVGRVLTETLPVTVKQYDAQGNPKVNGSPIQNLANTEFLVVTRFQYDARGNVIKKTEAEGLDEQRVTEYGYDKLDRLKTTQGEKTTIYTVADGEKQDQIPTETRTYDKRGNLIELKTADGARTLSYYDALNRQIAELSPVGTLTRLTYTLGSDVLTKAVYDDAVSLPAQVGGTPPQAVNEANARTTHFVHDANHRLTQVITKGMLVGEVNPQTGNYEIRKQDISLGKAYDGNGNVIVETDARGNQTRYIYDKAGNVAAKIDALRYVTLWEHNAAGQITQEKRYATALPASVSLQSASALQDIRDALGTSEFRQVSSTYNQMGWLQTQTVRAVESAVLSDSTHQAVVSVADAVTTYEYTALGQIKHKKEATGEELDWTYDVLGREIKSEGAKFADHRDKASQPSVVRQTAETEYNALGMTVRDIEKGYDSQTDRITFYEYGGNGWLQRKLDATGVSIYYRHDAMGRQTAQSLTRLDSQGANASTDITTHAYDLMGRVTQTLVHNLAGTNAFFANGTSYDALQTQEVAYNAHGDRRTSGRDGGWQVSAEYDALGRVLKTNADGGVTKAYVYDANGNATLSIESTGADLGVLSHADILKRQDLHHTVSVFDARNQLTDTYEPKITAIGGQASSSPWLMADDVVNASNPVLISAGASYAAWFDSVPPPGGLAAETINVVAIDSGQPARWSAADGYQLLGGAQGKVYIESPFVNLPGPMRIELTMKTPTVGAEGIYVDIVDSTATGNTLVCNIVGSGAVLKHPNQILKGEFRIIKTVNGLDVDISGPLEVVLDGRFGSDGPTYRRATLSFASPSRSEHTLFVERQPPGTTKVIMSYRSAGSSAPWKVSTLPVFYVDQNGEVLLAFGDSTGRPLPLPPNDYEFSYVAINDEGGVLNRAVGRMQVSDDGILLSQSAQQIGDAGYVLIDTDGQLNVQAQGGKATSSTLLVTPKAGGSTITLDAASAATAPGWFQFNLSSLNQLQGDYVYRISSTESDGTTVIKEITGDLRRTAIGWETLGEPALVQSSSNNSVPDSPGELTANSYRVISADSVQTAWSNRITGYQRVVAEGKVFIESSLVNLPGPIRIECITKTSISDMELLAVDVNQTSVSGNRLACDIVAQGLVKFSDPRIIESEFRIIKTIDGKDVDLSGPLQAVLDGRYGSERHATLVLNPVNRLVPAFTLQHQPTNATSGVIAYRKAGGSMPWTVITQRVARWEQNDETILVFRNATGELISLAADDYEFQYLEVNDAGDVFNAAAGVMSVSDEGVTITQSPRQISGVGQTIWGEDGQLHFMGLGGDQSVATLTIISENGQTIVYHDPVTLTSSKASTGFDSGFFSFDPQALGLAPGGYSYILTGHPHGIYQSVGVLLKGSFTLGEPRSLTQPEALPGYQDLTFQNLPRSVTHGVVRYKAKVPGAVEKTAVLNSTSPGILRWMALDVVSAQAQDYDVSLEAYDEGNQLVGAGTAVVSLGGRASQAVGLGSAVLTTQQVAAQQVILGVSNPVQSAHRSQKYDAYGELIEQVDTRGNVTTLSYNAMGKLISKLEAETTVVSETGKVTRERPQTSYAYDLMGRLISTVDANHHYSTQTWEALSVDGESKVGTEYHADGGQKINRHDRFGDLIEEINENWSGQEGTRANHTTTYGYDGNHRVLKVTRPLRDGLSVRGYDRYTYDSVGNRVAHYTTTDGINEMTPDRLEFDALGRVTKQVSSQGRATTTLYEDGVSVTGLGGKTVIGSRKTVTDANNRQLIDEMDISGRVTKHTDLGQHVYEYRYNGAGQLAAQSSSAGQNISYEYYANGRLKQINDHALNTYTKYAYDSEGNKTYEAYATKYDFNVYQRALIVYDELNRIKTITDPQYTLSYDYDAVGNRRHLIGTTTSTGTKQEFWYAYDAMDRFVVTMGSLLGTAGDNSTRIVAGSVGSAGVAIRYDLTGQRVQADIARDGHSERYSYTNDGFLSDTYLTNSGKYAAPSSANTSGTTASNTDYWQGAWRDNDLLGRVKSYTEYKPSGAGVASTNEFTYDLDGKTTYQKTVQSGSSSTTTTETTFNMYADGTVHHIYAVTNSTGGGATRTDDTYYTYEWWDSAQQSKITQKAFVPGLSEEWRPGASDLTYNVNGHLTSAIDRVGERVLTYVNNAQGLVLFRKETVNGADEYNQAFYYVDGQRVGETGNDQTEATIDYARALASATKPMSGFLRKFAVATGVSIENSRGVTKSSPITPRTEFESNYSSISNTYPAFTSNGYTVRQGDTLEGIARAVWGDSSLWYLIAEANGMMSASTELVEGQTLVIPNKVTNVHNNSSTRAVYNAAEAMGNVSPTLPEAPPPPPPPKKKGCGGVGMVVMIVVAIAVAAIVGPAVVGMLGQYATVGAALASGSASGIAAGVAGAAVGAAAGSIASQAVGMATGNVDKFSWSEVSRSAVMGAISAGATAAANASGLYAFDKATGVASSTWGAAGQAALSNTITQGVAVAAGLQKKFDWRGVAASAAGGAISHGLSAGTSPNTMAGFGRRVVSGLLSGAASAVIYDKKPQWSSIAANSFGSALGDAVVGKIAQVQHERAQAKLNAEIDGYLEGVLDGPEADHRVQAPANDGPYNVLDPFSLRDTRTQDEGVPSLADEFGQSSPSGAEPRTYKVGKGEGLEKAARALYGDNWRAGIAVLAADNNITKTDRFGNPIVREGAVLTARSLDGAADDALSLLGRAGGAIVAANSAQSAAVRTADAAAAAQNALLAGGSNGRISYENIFGPSSSPSSTEAQRWPTRDEVDAFFGRVDQRLIRGSNAITPIYPVEELLAGNLAFKAVVSFGVPVVRGASSLWRTEAGVANSEGAFSRIVPGGGLQAHENAGGHLLLKHVGQSEGALMNRLASEPRISGSSSFYNRATAEDAVSQILDANQAKISDWLSGSGGRLRLDHSLSNPVGISVTRGAPGAVDVSSGRVILVRDPSMQPGYKILTGFPTQP